MKKLFHMALITLFLVGCGKGDLYTPDTVKLEVTWTANSDYDGGVLLYAGYCSGPKCYKYEIDRKNIGAGGGRLKQFVFDIPNADTLYFIDAGFYYGEPIEFKVHGKKVSLPVYESDTWYKNFKYEHKKISWYE